MNHETQRDLPQATIASYADILLARHALLPNERLLKRAAISFPCPQRSAGDHVHD